jgi:hypothetical protein
MHRTPTQPERSSRVGDRTLLCGGALVLLAVGFGSVGCSSNDKLVAPEPLRSPWGAERVWAVAPLTNQSGVSTVDTLRLSDNLVAEAEAIDGVRCLPLNRSLAALQGLGIKAVATDADARSLMKTLQVDGLVVGTVTAYDPYQPLQLGLAVQLYTSDRTEPLSTDVRELTMATGQADGRGSTPMSRNGPAATASRVFDANNHDVLMRLDRYAAGRFNPKSGLRKNVYTASMDSFSRFVAYELLGELLATEAAKRAPRPDTAPGGG